MKGVIFICVLIITLSSFTTPLKSHGNKSTLTTIIEPTTFKDTLSKNAFINLKIKEYEKFTGQKLTLKEKIAFKIVQHNLKKELQTGKKPETRNKGKTALILGIIGLALVFVPYAAIASIPLAIIAIVMGNEAKKINPADKKARTGVILGWCTLGLILLLLIIGIIFLFAFVGSFG
jgi:hypothetical protein